MLSLCFIFFFGLLTSANSNNTVRIYSNLAEIIRPLDKLPLEFSNEIWNDIRSDSITLIGKDVNITLQTITEKKKSLNGTEIYIRSPLSNDKTTTTKLIKGILIDETTQLVRIQDESLADHKALYLTVSNDQIFYLEQPSKPKYFVNFTYTNELNSPIFVSYLRSNLNWQTQYQLNLHDNESDLIVMANIQNNGKSSVVIDQGELIGGDINLKMQQQQQQSLQYDRPIRRSRFGSEVDTQSKLSAMQMVFAESTEPIVEQGNELAGLYVFPIDKPFTIDAKTNYLLPMFRPHVFVERYGSISKTFSTMSTNGKAQRSYRLISDLYLSHGNCLIREQDRLVGETMLPNLAAKDKYEFSIGEDANVIYKENVTLISSVIFNETEPSAKSSSNRPSSTSVFISTRTRSAYEVHIQIKNFKDHPINLEYEQKGFYIYHSFKLIKVNKQRFIQDGSSIKSNMTLKANTDDVYSYTIEIVN